MSEDKQKKPFFKKIWFWVIVIIVIAAVAGTGSEGDEGSNNTSSSDSETAIESTDTGNAEEAEEEEGPYIIKDEEMVSEYGSAYIQGTLVNNTNKDWSYAQISYTLYDEDDAVIDSCYDNISAVKAGKSWKFSASSFTDYDEVAYYELDDVTY